MSTNIVLTNQKGGVGKTTTTSAIACSLVERRNTKVLAIDLDPQGNLGFSLGLDIENSSTIYEVLKGEMPLREAVQPTEYCDVITSNILLSRAELEFTGAGRESMLKNALEPVKDFYDYVVIDTPPALNVLTVNAYTVAHHLIIPMVPEILSLLAVTQIKETIDSVKSSFNPDLNVLGILLTKFNGRTILAREVKEMTENIARQMGTKVFETQIRNSVTVAEAPAHGESVFDYAPKSNPALDYRKFIEEIAPDIHF